jgi:hypothetical protein
MAWIRQVVTKCGYMAGGKIVGYFIVSSLAVQKVKRLRKKLDHQILN